MALVAGDRRLTFRELDERATRFANYLVDIGVEPGQHVGIYSVNRAEWVEAMFGCYKARAVPINVNYRYVTEELRYLFDNADLVALVYEAEFGPLVASALPGLPQLEHLIVLDDGSGSVTEELAAVEYERALESASPVRGFAPRSADDLYILYTGGTTGMPKASCGGPRTSSSRPSAGELRRAADPTPEQIADNVSASPASSLARAAHARQRAVDDVDRALRRQQRRAQHRSPVRRARDLGPRRARERVRDQPGR